MNNKEITLVIMAAGLGSRFGGLKQIEGVGPNNEFIIDYSIYDAIQAGFTKIVFIIKKEMYEIFKETIGSRITDKIKVEYAFQNINDLPNGYTLSKREKPLGTAHAILCAKDYVKTPFLVINADDFYGRDAFVKAITYLKNVPIDSNNYAMIAYYVKNTMSENGAVKRGICKTKDNYLIDLVESKVQKEKEGIIAYPMNGDSATPIENGIASMNMFLFTPTVFTYLEQDFPLFLEKNKNNLEEAEYFISDLLQKYLKSEEITMKVIETSAVWYGITYKEDKPVLMNILNKMIDDEIYPQNLWNR